MGHHDESQASSSLVESQEEIGSFLGEYESKLEFDIENQNAGRLPRESSLGLAMWIAINVLATIGIVFANKAIFSNDALRGAQLTFVCFHMLVTFITLHIASTARLAYFRRQRTSVRSILPLSVAMCLNIVLLNLSLAFSSIMFYQTCRILLTPVTAVLNYAFYRKKIPIQAGFALVPVCVGVGMVSYYNVRPNSDSQGTAVLGVVFAFAGVIASSVFTIWIGEYHQKLQMSSHQLLHNQSLCGAVLLLSLMPYVDTFPDWSQVSPSHWLLIVFSGFCAAAINLSQFNIVDRAGPVGSTVVGHSKTLSIVALGWITLGREISDKSIIGAVIALGGIMLYSVATFLYK